MPVSAPVLVPGALAGFGSGPLPVGARSAMLITLDYQLRVARARSIGYPGATDMDFADLGVLHERLVNNVGDPESDGRWRGHSKDVEREVIAAFAGLFGGSPDRTWGYVSAGGSSEGVLHGVWLGRERLPGARVYHSRAAHYCVPKAAHLLGLEASVVGVDDGGQILYDGPDSLAAALHPHRDRPALVVATAGTTMTEAVDDVASIHEVLDAAGVPDRHIVIDAALSGPALALDGGPTARLLAEHGGWGRADADAVCFSSHKSLGTPHVSGVVLTRREHTTRVLRAVDYLGGTDATISGSRSGQAPVELWHVLATLGPDGLRQRAHAARAVAEHTVTHLTDLGWPAWRHPHAWTVVLAQPPADLAERWQLATSSGRSHIVCAPGITTALIDKFVAELAATTHEATTHEEVQSA